MKTSWNCSEEGTRSKHMDEEESTQENRTVLHRNRPIFLGRWSNFSSVKESDDLQSSMGGADVELGRLAVPSAGSNTLMNIKSSLPSLIDHPPSSFDVNRNTKASPILHCEDSLSLLYLVCTLGTMCF